MELYPLEKGQCLASPASQMLLLCSSILINTFFTLTSTR